MARLRCERHATLEMIAQPIEWLRLELHLIHIHIHIHTHIYAPIYIYMATMRARIDLPACLTSLTYGHIPCACVVAWSRRASSILSVCRAGGRCVLSGRARPTKVSSEVSSEVSPSVSRRKMRSIWSSSPYKSKFRSKFRSTFKSKSVCKSSR